MKHRLIHKLLAILALITIYHNKDDVWVPLGTFEFVGGDYNN